mgnify:CR=1 FL=1
MMVLCLILVIKKALLNLKFEPIFDIAVVDEVQDLSKEEWDLIEMLCKRITALGDFNQGVYETNLTKADVVQKGLTEKLTDIFRFHKNIAKTAQAFSRSKEKLEDKVTPNKRGSIVVNVKAAHDAKNLYMQFSWADTDHTPSPFTDGGKMDKKNEIKLAFMLATDEVEYADRAGCWGTCHADLNEMPFAPEGQNVTKYIKESRTKIEIKGRGGKPKGGWDKRKTDAEIDAELAANRYMDIIRYKSGEKKTEDGNILADRHMNEKLSSEFTAVKKGNQWVVEVVRPLKEIAGKNIELALDQTYNFGFAIHDDYTNGRFHHVSLGYKLGFDNADVEINAMKQ